MNILRKTRKNAGLTQEKAAKLIGISKRTLIRWEMSNNIPDLVNVVKISKVYNLPLEELCTALIETA